MESKKPFVKMVSLPAALEYLKRRANVFPMPKEMYRESLHFLHEVFDCAGMEVGIETAVICRCPKCRGFPSITYKKEVDAYGAANLEVRIKCTKECDMPPFIVRGCVLNTGSFLFDQGVSVDERVSIYYENMEYDAIKNWNDGCMRYNIQQDSHSEDAAVNFTKGLADEQ